MLLKYPRLIKGPLLAGQLAIILLVACAKPGPSRFPIEIQTPVTEEAPVPDPTLPAGTEENVEDPAANSGRILVLYQRSGGIAGLRDEWRIYRDGRIEGLGDELRQVSTNEIDDLMATIQRNDFAGLDASYAPSDTCCDRITYTVTAYFEDGQKTVSTIDAAPDQPDQLTAVLEAIEELIAPD